LFIKSTSAIAGANQWTAHHAKKSEIFSFFGQLYELLWLNPTLDRMV
jgi:hypothetical protein